MQHIETEADLPQIIEQIRRLAGTRHHRLARQLTQLDRITLKAAQSMRSYLNRQPQLSPAPAAAPIAAQVEQASASGLTAAAKAGGAPASDERPGRRPGAKVTEPGIYYFEKRVYKVIRSQYSGHLQARRLNPEAKRDKWTYVEGMMGILRASDKMTAAQSIEFEELYGFPACTDCGAVLENDLSRARRVGPVCWEKNNHTDDEIGE